MIKRNEHPQSMRQLVHLRRQIILPHKHLLIIAEPRQQMYYVQKVSVPGPELGLEPRPRLDSREARGCQ